MIEVEGLHYTYAGYPPTLQGLDLRVPDGESGFLLGPSGSGKSTLLRCIAGLLPDYTGTIRVGGRALEGLPPHRRRVGMLWQEPTLFPHLDVAGNVAFGLRYTDVPRDAWPDEVERFLRLVHLEDRADAHVDHLSGGQRRRVELARTLAARPRAVLLDEPLAALDADMRLALGRRVRDLLHRQGVPALWVTHDETEAQRLGHRTWRLEAGRAVRQKRD